MSHPQATFRKDVAKYLIGAVVATILTFVSYFTVTHQWLMGTVTIATSLLVLAVVQMIAQLVFFLHLDHEAKPRWRTTSFVFTFTMLMVVVVGSLWIMMHLNYRMVLSGDQMNTYMIEQNKKGF